MDHQNMDEQVMDGQVMDEQNSDLLAVAAVLGDPETNAPPRTATSASAASGGELPEGEMAFSVFSDPGVVKFKKRRNAYTWIIKIGTTVFRGVNLPPALLKKFSAEQRKFSASAARIERTGKQIEAGKDRLDVEEFEAAIDKLEADGIALAEATVAFNEGVIEATLRQWEDPNWEAAPPCNAENRKALSPETKAQLADEILSKSFAGRSRSGFLERS